MSKFYTEAKLSLAPSTFHELSIICILPHKLSMIYLSSVLTKSLPIINDWKQNIASPINNGYTGRHGQKQYSTNQPQTILGLRRKNFPDNCWSLNIMHSLQINYLVLSECLESNGKLLILLILRSREQSNREAKTW